MGLTIHFDVQGAPTGTPHTHVDRAYFGGSDQLRQTLVEMGMGFDSPVPEFPDSDHLDRTDFRDGEPITDRAWRYEIQRADVLADHGAGSAAGIPGHKLYSADNWHVTACECAQALAAYHQAIHTGLPHPAAFGADVIPFLRTAAAFDGFRVH